MSHAIFVIHLYLICLCYLSEIGISLLYPILWASLVAQMVKKSACNVGDLGLIPRLGRPPGGGHGNPCQYSCLENPHGQRNLAGYSPWHRKESNMTEQLSTAQYSVVCIPHSVYLFILQ